MNTRRTLLKNLGNDDQLDQTILRLGETQERMIDAERQRDNLERERDDLRKAVNGLCEHLGVSPANTTLLAVQVLRIERERDEWKAEAERLKNACDKWSESEMFLHLIGDTETSDIINGLLHTAEDHPCCKGTLLVAASLLLEYSKA
jgi:FtsZ-binding cell division protein ZapB